MDEAARTKYIERYEAAYRRFGYSPRGLCSSDVDRSPIRFSILAHAPIAAKGSVLDVGCGFADLYLFLKQAGWTGHYTGIDVVPSLIEEARRRHPEANLILGDGSEDLARLGSFDHVICCGAMNLRLPNGENESHIRTFMSQMFDVAKVSVAIDFMTTLVDFQDPEAWHTDPTWALSEAQKLTRRVFLRADYLPYEYMIFMLKDRSQSPGSVFTRSAF